MALRRYSSQWLMAVCTSLCLSWLFLVLTSREGRQESESPMSSAPDQNKPIEPCSVTERLDHVEKMCRRLRVPSADLSNLDTYSRIIVDDESKLLFCVIGKAGCTSWKSVLVNHLNSKRNLNLTQNAITKGVFLKDFMAKLGLVFMHTLPIQEIKYRIDNYFKFMVVRHPFDRLISAYMDKMVDNDYKRRYYPRYVIQKYGNEEQKRNIETANPTFDQFLQYVYKDSLRVRDMHWQRYESTCHPCSIHYDYIGKLETMDHDAPHILSHIGHDAYYPRQLPYLNNNSRKKSGVLKEFDAISEQTIYRLYQFYQTDFKLFGYQFDNKSVVCEQPRTDGTSCC